ncbi:hypothetical protein KIPE111705_06345 [Kibdelosporangium persicum]
MTLRRGLFDVLPDDTWFHPGRNGFPSTERLTRYTCLSERAVRTSLELRLTTAVRVTRAGIP